MDKHTAEIWVKVICILSYIGAGFCILAGLFLMLGGRFIISLLSAIIPAQYTGFLAGLAIVAGIFLIVVGVVYIFVAMSLWKHKNWARILYIVFAALGAFGALFSLPANIVTLVIDCGVIYLLAFDKDVMKLFK